MNESEKTGPPITLFIVGDHGGHGHTHGTTVPADRLVPWIVVGPGIKVGHQITGMVRLIDTVPTIIRVFGLDQARVLPDADGQVIKEIFDR